MEHGEDAVSLDHRLRRLENLEREMADVTTRLATLTANETVLINGVSNFRLFQLDMRQKVGFMYGVAWLFGILNGVALVIFSVVLSQAMPVVKAAISEYYRNHPAARYERKEPPISQDTYTVHSKFPPQFAKE